MIFYSLLRRRKTCFEVAVIWAFLIASVPSLLAQERIAPAHVNVVALMVEFQPDTTRFTTGDGTFGGVLFEGTEPPKLDRLPHDRPYFQAHLSFLEDYVRKVSDNRTNVTTFVLPQVVRLSKKMGAYSPTGLEADSDIELAKLASMVNEAWSLANASGVQLPAGYTSENTAFVLFHAGVGRDIELVGTTLDKTPEDLPSLFFSQSVLNRLGVATPMLGGVAINNTLVIPRTESRLGYNVIEDAPFLVELSINGLLAASFLNYLGVPDLFNTQTGESAIGPFDVMDALGIFAFGGLFPPEPSAWTKSYLGWADVTEFTSATDQNVSLTYVGDSNRNEVAKIKISDTEYFLVENRHRDPENDGIHLKVWRNGVIEDVHFPNADPEFNDVTISGFEGGVVVSVDQYDFALPGGEDEFGNPLVGGALIWHIDENRIRAGLESNSVNADPTKRGIDLEEADGAQDIGYPSAGGGFFGSQYDLGSPFDFWFASNPVSVRTLSGREITLYQNRFAADTYPSSHANNGTPSQVRLSSFSDPAPEITFVVDQHAPVIWQSVQSVQLTQRDELDLTQGWFAAMESENGPSDPMVFGSTEVPGFSIRSPGWQMSGLKGLRPVVTQFGTIVLANSEAQGDSELRLIQPNGATHHITIPLGAGLEPTSNMNWFWDGNTFTVRFGASVFTSSYLVTAVVSENGFVSVTTTTVQRPIRQIVGRSRSSSDAFYVTENAIIQGASPVSGVSFPLASSNHFAMDFALEGSNWMATYSSESSSEVILLHSDGSRFAAPLDFGNTGADGANCVPTKAVFAKMGSDRNAKVVVGCGRYLYAFHPNGVLVSGFPFVFDAEIGSDPVVEFEPESGATLIYVQTAVGNLDGVRVTTRAERISGFPLSIGAPSLAAPFLAADGIWTFSATGSATKWSQEVMQRGEVRNQTDLDEALLVTEEAQPGTNSSSRLLKKDETYNWPNPIEQGQTHIRFETLLDAMVDVIITDTAGGLIERFESVQTVGGRPSEIKWTTTAQSGIYLARISARSLDGTKSDVRLVKMAIIR